MEGSRSDGHGHRVFRRVGRIDGYTSNTVEQIGTESDVASGTPSYYAWYEMYPQGYVTVPLTISAGDSISASVSYASGQFTVTITDNTTGKSYSPGAMQRSRGAGVVGGVDRRGPVNRTERLAAGRLRNGRVHQRNGHDQRTQRPD